ncbi:hypothetical protein AB0395_21680 [Streptosporangium sp. NPDC051023]|uniref:hypothetical protein n=1 Tax=Streptosporangium sp. NPDC051023 TaxID=3155410 RepID=UPI00344FFFD0
MIGSGPIEEPGDPRLMALTAYAGSRHIECVLRGTVVLRHLHSPGDPHAELKCPTCRDSHGRRLPWPCRTYIEMVRALGGDPRPALDLADAMGIKIGPLLDIEALMHTDRQDRQR